MFHISQYFYLTTTELADKMNYRFNTLCGINPGYASFWADGEGNKEVLVDVWHEGRYPTCDACCVLYLEAREKALEYLREKHEEYSH